MPEELVVRHASPTLAGMKTANMFLYHVKSKTELSENLRKWNRILRKKGIRAIPLRYKNQNALIYIYRVNKLACDLRDNLTESLLRERGYSPDNPQQAIKKLINELENNESFPHEIGLFLGYPPEDVLGYIKNLKPYNLRGYWKVYENEKEKEKIFNKFRKCTKIYCEKIKEGKDIERMILA